MLKKGDIILIAGALLVLVLGMAGLHFYRNYDSGAQKIAVIKYNDKVVREINLDKLQKQEKITVSGDYENIIIAEKGRIRFEDVDCPDKVCVKTGWLSKKGDTAVCLPNHTIIKIEGEQDKVDGVAY